MVRIAIGGISHETNTFSTIRTDLVRFERTGIHRGEAILADYGGTRTVLGGFLDGANREGFEAVPLLMAAAAPSGTVAAETFDALTRELVEGLRAVGPLDGVLLELHGAMVAEDARDGDREILRRVRQVVGSLPIVATLDLHANISQGMVDLADALVGYDTYPHVDTYERGLEAAEIVARLARGRLRVVRALRTPALLPPLPKQCTSYDTPMRALLELAHAREGEPGIVSVTVAAGFPYADVPEAGLSVLVHAEGDQARAEGVADEIATRAWELRRDFLVRCTPVEEALAAAVEASAGGSGGEGRGPLVLADTGDNPGAGAACDGTVLLAGLLERGVSGAAIGALADPEAVARCHEAGVGARVELALGGKTDERHGPPLPVRGEVRFLSDGRFKNRGPMSTGAETRMGRTAVLVCDGVEVVVTENRVQALDGGVFLSQGIDPATRRVLVLKSSVHYRGAFEPLARRVIEVDSPGLSNSALERFPFRHLRRPIFPLDPL